MGAGSADVTDKVLLETKMDAPANSTMRVTSNMAKVVIRLSDRVPVSAVFRTEVIIVFLEKTTLEFGGKDPLMRTAAPLAKELPRNRTRIGTWEGADASVGPSTTTYACAETEPSTKDRAIAAPSPAAATVGALAPEKVRIALGESTHPSPTCSSIAAGLIVRVGIVPPAVHKGVGAAIAKAIGYEPMVNTASPRGEYGDVRAGGLETRSTAAASSIAKHVMAAKKQVPPREPAALARRLSGESTEQLLAVDVEADKATEKGIASGIAVWDIPKLPVEHFQSTHTRSVKRLCTNAVLCRAFV